MRKRIGWTKSWRKKWDNPSLRGRPNHLLVWDWIISHAVFKEQECGRTVRFKGKLIELEDGQLTCGSHEISLDTGVKPSTVRRVVKDLVSEQLVEQLFSHSCSLIKVKNWSSYQGSEQPSEQRMSSELAANEQRVSTKEEEKNHKNKKKLPELDLEILKWAKRQGKGSPEGYLAWMKREYGDVLPRAWSKSKSSSVDVIEICKHLKKHAL